MSTDQASSTPIESAPVASPAPAAGEPSPVNAARAAQAAPTPPAARSGGLWLGSLALLLAVAALVVAGMLWQKLGFTQQEMARRSQENAAQSVETRTLATQADALTRELQARLAVAEVKVSEVSLQRSQLEELMLSLSRSRDDNLVQDIDSALRLAMQQTQLTGSAQPLLSALQAADQRIDKAAQPRLNAVQRAIARDIERIQSAALTDVPSLVRRVDELVKQVDTWPTHNEGPAQPVPSAAVAPSTAAGAQTSPTNAAPLSAWGRVYSAWAGFWARSWASLTQSGRELVRVSRIDRPEAALMAPEQVFFLRENIKLRLLNARLGLLARQTDSTQSDLMTTEQALGRYFDNGTPSVQAALESLASLRGELAKSELPRPDESLAALATAAGGR